MSKDGLMIDLEREEVIAKLPSDHNKKSMQSFMGKINFIHRFIPIFSKTVKPLQGMVKQKHNISGKLPNERPSQALKKL